MLEVKEIIEPSTDNTKKFPIKASILFISLILFLVWCIFIAISIFTPAEKISIDWIRFLEYESPFYLDIITKIPRNLEYLLALVFFLVSAIGPGYLGLSLLKIDWKDAVERTLLSLATGIVFFTFATLLLGTFGLLQKKFFFPLIGIAFLLTGWYLVQLPRWKWAGKLPLKTPLRFNLNRKTIVQIGLIVLIFAYVYQALLGGLTPETQFDARHYHLGPAKHYAQKDYFYNIVAETGLFGAAYPPYQHLVYTGLIEMFGVITAKLFHWSYAVLTVFLLIYFCYYHFKSLTMGLVAGLIFVSTPLILWAGGTANTDLPLAFFGLLAVHAFLRWKENKTATNWLIVLGITVGYATGIKLFGAFCLILIVPALVYFSFSEKVEPIPPRKITRRLIIQLSVLGLTLFVCCVPWLLRSYLLTGNPVYPLLNNFFNSPYWSSAYDEQIKLAYLRSQTDRSLWGYLTLPWSTVMEANKFRSIFGPLFLMLLPVTLCLIILVRGKLGYLLKMLGWYVVGWITVWFVSGATESRYTLAAFPVITVLLAFAITTHYWKNWAGKLFQISLIVVLITVGIWNSPFLVSYQIHSSTPGVNARPGISWEYLYRGKPEVTIIVQYLPMVQYINQNLSIYTDKVLDYTSQRNPIYMYLYNEVEALDGRFFEELKLLNFYDENTLAQLKQKSITHVLLNYSKQSKFLNAPIGKHLREIHRIEVIDEILFKIDYPANI
jgi:Dolichyl-phosphate-mannose-protein mannosyltransferase